MAKCKALTGSAVKKLSMHTSIQTKNRTAAVCSCQTCH